MYINRLILLIIAIMYISVMMSCGDKLTYVKDENGHVVESYQANEEGRKHGEFKRFDTAGNIQETATYINGKLHGVHQFYYPDGQLELVENYDNDIIVGPCTSYYNNGQVKLDFVYDNGVMNGIVKKYYEHGQLMEEVMMSNNEENGVFKEYHENGQIKWEGQYLNGEHEFGLLKNYDKSGKLVKKMMCDSLAICRTIWTKEKGDIKLEPLNLNIKLNK